MSDEKKEEIIYDPKQKDRFVIKTKELEEALKGAE
jgi:hypothetical protein